MGKVVTFELLLHFGLGTSFLMSGLPAVLKMFLTVSPIGAVPMPQSITNTPEPQNQPERAESSYG